MLPTAHVPEFALISLALIVVPGPNVLFAVSRSLQHGRIAGLAAVTGGQAGVYVLVVAVALGIGTLVERSAAGHIPLQMLLLGAIFVGRALISDSTWALIAGTARDWFARSPRRLEIVGGTGGLVMIGIGASLALTGRTD
jgi:threonine/homoserine/homoserine lactone efflux protein